MLVGLIAVCSSASASFEISLCMFLHRENFILKSVRNSVFRSLPWFERTGIIILRPVVQREVEDSSLAGRVKLVCSSSPPVGSLAVCLCVRYACAFVDVRTSWFGRSWQVERVVTCAGGHVRNSNTFFFSFVFL